MDVKGLMTLSPGWL